VKKLRSGALLIEVSRPAQAQNLLKQTAFASVPVVVTPHRTMNSCKGVIRDRDLADMDMTELVDELKCVGVTDARNILQNRNGSKVKTAAIILTFSRAILPKSIKAGYTHIKVEPYIPNPLRCFTCQGFGHHQSTCKRNKVCARCGQSDHGSEPCTAAPHCANCNGDHPAYATSCPKWVTEKEICKIKVTLNVTYPEARKMINPVSNQSSGRITYSAMTQGVKTMATIGTQTDIVNCKCQIHPLQTNNMNNKSETILKQASNQTDDTLESQDVESDVGNSSQQKDLSWTMVGRSRHQSLSPRKKSENRGQGTHRGKAGEPPDKQPRAPSPQQTNKQERRPKKILMVGHWVLWHQVATFQHKGPGKKFNSPHNDKQTHNTMELPWLDCQFTRTRNFNSKFYPSSNLSAGNSAK